MLLLLLDVKSGPNKSPNVQLYDISEEFFDTCVKQLPPHLRSIGDPILLPNDYDTDKKKRGKSYHLTHEFRTDEDFADTLQYLSDNYPDLELEGVCT